MKVEIWLEKTSQGITLEPIEATYQKGDMFCVKRKDEDTVYKYPVNHIFCIKETSFKHSHVE